MKIAPTLIIASLVTALSTSASHGASPAFTPIPAAPKLSSCADPGSMSPTINLLTKELSLALIAADKNQLQVSANHIAIAEKELDKLIVSKPVISAADQLSMVRLDYQQGKELHFILLPIDDESGLNDIKALQGAIPKDSKVVAMHMRIDGSKVKTTIEKIGPFLSAKDNTHIAVLLQDILADIGNKEIAEKPNYLRIIYDHMRLTDNLLTDGLYDYARFSLQHVKENLKLYTATVNDPKKNNDIKELSLNVSILSDTLTQKNPTELEKIRGKMREWMKSVALH